MNGHRASGDKGPSRNINDTKIIIKKNSRRKNEQANIQHT